MNVERLLELERHFWKADADFYRQNVAAEALFVFTEPVGVLDKQRSIAAIEEGERWADVELKDVQAVEISSGVTMLVYKAASRTESGISYSPLATSVYVERNGSPLLILHQQIPPVREGSGPGSGEGGT